MNRKEKMAAILFAIALVMILSVTFEKVVVELVWMAAWISTLLAAVKIYKRNYEPTEEDRA